MSFRDNATSDEVEYIQSLVDPFNNKIAAPKLRDGKTQRSVGIRLRSTGEIVCDSAGITTVCLFPGISNVVAWKNATGVNLPLAFPAHVGTLAEYSTIKHIRSVGSGLRLVLINNADQNEGYWEAVRIPIEPTDFGVPDASFRISPTLISLSQDISNYQTYMSGKNRDLHRYQFKVNSNNAEHPFALMAPAGTNMTDIALDQSYDMIIIKIHGRSDSVSPTVLMFDAVSNQEIVYQENTALARLMTPTKMHSNNPVILQSTNYSSPAVQIN